jgi:hypothetical protein
MSATPTSPALKVELPEITRADIARFVKEGRRRRADETDKLFRAIGQGLTRVLCTMAAVPGRFLSQPSQGAA